MVQFWDQMMLCSPNGDPKVTEIDVILNHYNGTGVRAIQYKRIEGARADWMALQGYFMYNVLIEVNDGSEEKGDSGV